jgi:hypothetical protein
MLRVTVACKRWPHKDRELETEIFKWCRNNAGTDWEEIGPHYREKVTIGFESEADAVMFKLTFVDHLHLEKKRKA